MAGDRQEFLLPTVDEGATQATVVRWLVAPGDRVLVDRPVCLVDVGVDGRERLLELTSPFKGTVVSVGADAGDAVRVGEMLLTVAGDNRADGGKGRADDHRHSPLVRRLANDFGVDLTTIAGTGPGGRITRVDVQRAAFPDDPVLGSEAPAQADVPDVGNDPAPDSDGPVHAHSDDNPALASEPGSPAAAASESGDRGESVQHAKQAHRGTRANPTNEGAPADGRTFAMSATADAGQLLRAHERLADGDDGPVAMDALFVRIVAMAARDLPLFAEVDAAVTVGFARLTDNRVVDAEISAPHDLPLADLDRRMHEVTVRAQRGRSTVSDVPPAVTVIDAGGLGMTTMTPLLAPGAAATIAFGRLEPRPWLVDGAVRNGWLLTATGTFDAARVDVALAALLLRRIRLYAEDPILAFAG